MFINDETMSRTFELQDSFWLETFGIEASMLKGKDWTVEAALDIIKIYCGM